MYTYAWYHWITFFYIYCFFGWCFESTYVSLREHRPVNRGFLRLPLIPLYGTGAVMLLWASLPVKEHLPLVYLVGVIVATALEYVTGYTMERLFKMKYWDYSDQRFNLHGYICLSSSITWGFMTLLVTEVIHRPIERMVLRLPFMTEVVILVLISVLFVYDAIQSTKAAFNMARALERMAKLREELDDLQVQMALLRAETAQNLAERKDEMALGFMARREAVAEGIQNRYDAVAEGIQTRYDAVTEGIQNRYGAVADKLQAGREAVAEGIQNRKEAVSDKLEAVADGLQERREARAEAAQERREARAEAAQERRTEELQIFKDAQAEQLRLLNAEYTKKAAQFQQIVLPVHLDILRRNPSASSRRFRKVFGELRDRIAKKSA
jgi:uncharacterized membrane protein